MTWGIFLAVLAVCVTYLVDRFLAARETAPRDPGPFTLAVAKVVEAFAEVVSTVRTMFLACLVFLWLLVQGISAQVGAAIEAAAADKQIEVITALGLAGLYLLVAGGVLGLMGGLIAGPNPLAVIADKGMDLAHKLVDRLKFRD